jgi:hypothetical protein
MQGIVKVECIQSSFCCCTNPVCGGKANKALKMHHLFSSTEDFNNLI